MLKVRYKFLNDTEYTNDFDVIDKKLETEYPNFKPKEKLYEFVEKIKHISDCWNANFPNYISLMIEIKNDILFTINLFLDCGSEGLTYFDFVLSHDFVTFDFYQGKDKPLNEVEIKRNIKLANIIKSHLNSDKNLDLSILPLKEF